MTSQNRRPTMKDNQAKYPQLRFKGFTDPWEERKLSEIVDIYDGTHQTPIYTDSGVKFVSVENISNLETKKYISQEAYNKEYAKKQAQKGDVLMTRIGDIGTSRVIETEEPLAYYVTLSLLKPKKIESNFLSWLISSPEVQRNIWKRTLHIAFPKKINLGEINQVEVMIPKNKEQQKIGSFFKQLDDTIALHQRKLAKLKKLKQGYLQKLFPENGSKFPQLRFAGFADAWEQRKLTEIVNRVNKSSNSDVLPKVEFEDIVSGEGRLNKDISSKLDSRKGTLFESENILYGKLRPYLKNWLFPDFEGVALGDFWVFEATDVSVPSFDYYLIQSDDYQKVANDTSGTKMPRSDWKNVSSTDFAIPSKDEQKQIGAFFKQLDDTITLHQRKLEKLQELKKGYLQKMFC